MFKYNIRNDLPLLYDFYLVAKEGGFAKTAKKYFLSQPNLSRNVKSLENKLNLQLFITSPSGAKLTSDGQKLFNELDTIFSNQFFSNEIDNDFVGTITIGTTRNIADYKLEKYLTESYRNYPNIKIRILTDSATNLNNYLLDHKIDVLIDYLPHINTTEKYDLKVIAIDEFKTCFACSKTLYEKIHNDIKELKDLNNYNLVIQGSSRRKQYLDELLQKNNIKLETKMEMPDSKLMIDFVKNNDFIGYFVEDELDNNLAKLELKEEMPFNSIGVIYHNKTINKLAKAFVDLMTK